MERRAVLGLGEGVWGEWGKGMESEEWEGVGEGEWGMGLEGKGV